MATFWTDIGMCFESFQRLGSNEKKEARARLLDGDVAVAEQWPMTEGGGHAMASAR
jgi:hypothetical protein